MEISARIGENVWLSLSLSPCVWLSELVFPSILVEILPDVDLPSAEASLHCHGNFCSPAASPPLHGLHNHVGIPENFWPSCGRSCQSTSFNLSPWVFGCHAADCRETNNLGNGFVLSFLAV
jgi:hypothetical protein